MDWDRFRNMGNLDLVEPIRIRDSINACIRLLFTNFLTLKMSYTRTYSERYSSNTSSNINFLSFFVADVKCGLYEINKNNRANATHGPSTVQKNVPRPNRSDVGLERSRTRTQGPGPKFTDIVLRFILTYVLRSS